VVIENGSGRYGIIDINAFPGYDGYPDFFDRLMNCVLEVIDHHPHAVYKPDPSDTKFCLPLTEPTVKNKNSDSMSPGCGDHGDSGIDTGDSSDEKKKRDFPLGSLSASTR